MFKQIPSLAIAALASCALACGAPGANPVNVGGSAGPAAETGTKKQPVGGTIHTDTFTQGSQVGGYADILFVVDNSCSMHNDQVLLANSFNTFINWVTQENVDFHIAITTTDMSATGEKGAFVGAPAVLDNNTPNLVSAFTSNVMVGINGYGVEKGFEAAVAALTPPLSDTVNAGFLRANAKLYVVFVSDENDFSALTTDDFIASITALKADPGQVHFTAIAGEANAPCVTVTPKYNDLISKTGGLFGSICQTDFGLTLQQLAFEVIDASGEYFLTQLPDPSTFTVTVNGVVQPSSRWTYHPDTNSVELLPAYIPAPGSQIVVTYEIAGSAQPCLSNGEVVYDLDGGDFSWKFFCVDVPAGTTKLLVHLWDGKGDADLYLKLGSKPGAGNYDLRSIIEEQDETLLLENPAPGIYHFGVYGFSHYDDVNLQAMWIDTASSAPQQTRPVLSGVFYDTPGTDSVEEYVELYNGTQSTVNLDGWSVHDNGGSWTFPQGTSLAPGAFMVVAKNAAGFQNLFGKAPTLVGLSISLNNNGDWLMLKDANGDIADFVAWENASQGWTLNAASGSAIERVSAEIDTDTEADWAVTQPMPRGL